MTRKIARRAGRTCRYIVHEVWVSLQVSGAVWFPVGSDVARVLQAVRESDAAWRNVHRADS